jgi:hypothetical protein
MRPEEGHALGNLIWIKEYVDVNAVGFVYHIGKYWTAGPTSRWN